ncbi:MAG TPA: helix-turn-helix domain-containing protein [Sulfolobales archaeon]|nr:helix-turn-helix domain-containing protein [Sulfolobales archaeon]
MVSQHILDDIARRIAGDIIWSNDISLGLRKWREIFGAARSDIAKLMGVSQSVISDYEKGRRIPGAKFVRRYVESLLKFDATRGYQSVKSLARSFNLNIEAVIDSKEFEIPMQIDTLITRVKGVLLNATYKDRELYGYTVIDSIKAISTLSGNEFWNIMGMTSERALIFTSVTTGRSPMIAVRVAPIKPASVVLHGTKRVDPLAIYLAESEGIPLILSTAESVDEIISGLRSYQ